MFGWLKRIALTDKPKTVGEVMDSYGALLEKYPLAIIDISMLPIPKTQMKAVLKGLYARTGDARRQELLETGFLFLSRFQDGVGPTPIEAKSIKGDVRQNLQANMATLDKWLAWDKLSGAEMEILAGEWQRFKDGEPI